MLGTALLGWSVADLLARTTTSPLTMLGHLALAPVASQALVAGGVVAVGAVVALGLARARHISLEPVLRRAQLVHALRFAATIQDLRAVITLRRQLTHEQSRARPWLRLRPAAPTGGACWRRDWQGILRWPGARAGRVAVLTVVAGACCAGALRGTTPLLAVAPIATYLVALDVVEGLAQEVDHPDRGNGLPQTSGSLYASHLNAPFALTGLIGLVGLGVGLLVAAAIPAGAHQDVPVLAGVAVVVAVTALAPTAAALSVYLGRPDRDVSIVLVHPGVVAAQQFGPIVLVALAYVPLLVAARDAVHRPIRRVPRSRSHSPPSRSPSASARSSDPARASLHDHRHRRPRPHQDLRRRRRVVGVRHHVRRRRADRARRPQRFGQVHLPAAHRRVARAHGRRGHRLRRHGGVTRRPGRRLVHPRRARALRGPERERAHRVHRSAPRRGGLARARRGAARRARPHRPRRGPPGAVQPRSPPEDRARPRARATVLGARDRRAVRGPRPVRTTRR